MNVGVDETRKRQPAVERHGAGVALGMRGDLGDAAVAYADVDLAIPPGDPGLAQHKVERHWAILLRVLPKQQLLPFYLTVS